MTTFAVGPVISEIDSRLTQIKQAVDRPLKEGDANSMLVDLCATVELINRYADSELLSGTSALAGKTATKSLSDVVLGHLKDWIARVREIVLKIAHDLHASTWMVTLGFPWNLSLTLGFDVPKQ